MARSEGIDYVFLSGLTTVGLVAVLMMVLSCFQRRDCCFGVRGLARPRVASHDTEKTVSVENDEVP